MNNGTKTISVVVLACVLALILGAMVITGNLAGQTGCAGVLGILSTVVAALFVKSVRE